MSRAVSNQSLDKRGVKRAPYKEMVITAFLRMQKEHQEDSKSYAL